MNQSREMHNRQIMCVLPRLPWDCVAAIERLPVLHYSVDFIFCPLGSWVSLWNFEIIRGSLTKPKWPKLASLAQEMSTL